MPKNNIAAALICILGSLSGYASSTEISRYLEIDLNDGFITDSYDQDGNIGSQYTYSFQPGGRFDPVELTPQDTFILDVSFAENQRLEITQTPDDFSSYSQYGISGQENVYFFIVGSIPSSNYTAYDSEVSLNNVQGDTNLTSGSSSGSCAGSTVCTGGGIHDNITDSTMTFSGFSATYTNIINDNLSAISFDWLSGFAVNAGEVSIVEPVVAPFQVERVETPYTLTKVYEETVSDESLKKGLVVITHGHTDNASTWVTEMANDIGSAIDENTDPSTNWSVATVDWRELADNGFLNPGASADNATLVGALLGEELVLEGYDYIHFIGHSAGSWVVQSAVSHMNHDGSDAEITTTLLDAYVSGANTKIIDGVLVDYLGTGSDYAEQYFHEPDWALTGMVLRNAYNIEVTPEQPIEGLNDGHRYPYQWYIDSINTNTTGQFGFADSREVKGYQYLTHETHERGDCTALYHEECNFIKNGIETTKGVVKEKLFNFGMDLLNKSATGFVNSLLNGEENSYGLITGSPVWAIYEVDLTEEILGISLDVIFDGSASAEGLLAIYWDDYVLGTFDQRFGTSFEDWLLYFSDDWGAIGRHTLSFRLDAYGEETASVQILNISGISADVPAPPPLALLTIGLLALSYTRCRKAV